MSRDTRVKKQYKPIGLDRAYSAVRTVWKDDGRAHILAETKRGQSESFYALGIASAHCATPRRVRWELQRVVSPLLLPETPFFVYYKVIRRPR